MGRNVTLEKEKKRKIYKMVMLEIVTVFITALLTAVFVYQYASKNPDIKYIAINSGDSQISTVLSSFRKIIEENYLGEINEQDLMEGAIKGYVAGLKDPYSEYFTKEEMEEYTEEALGNFEGIGIYMIKDIEKNAITVLAPIEESPAEKAGIKPGDIITKVDGVSYNGDSMSEASSKIKGEKGTKVNLEILRDNEVLNLEIERMNVKVNHIKTEVLENNIGYLKIATFDEGCSDEFKEKCTELKHQGIKGLIIDLRNNGGGIVTEATDIADMLLEKGKTSLITVDKKENEKITKSEKNPILDIPVIVLTNKNTASSSEILAGALKDNGRAKILGTKTYGKGVIQTLKYFTDGSGIKITTNEYYTPNRNKINKVGIEPDEEVKLPEEVKNEFEVTKEQDTQLNKAIELLK